jgi:hypothetical protein
LFIYLVIIDKRISFLKDSLQLFGGVDATPIFVMQIVPSNPTTTEITNFDISIFEIDKEKGMVNLTKIANHFGKEVFDWKRLANTKRFLDVFFIKNPERVNLVVVNGGISGIPIN